MSSQIFPAATKPRAGLLLFCLALAPSMTAGSADKDDTGGVQDGLDLLLRAQEGEKTLAGEAPE